MSCYQRYTGSFLYRIFAILSWGWVSSLFGSAMLFIPLASIIGLANLVGILLKKPISYSLSLTISLVIGCLYLGLIFEVLEMTAILLLSIGIIVPSIIQVRRLRHLPDFKNFSSTALLYLIVFLSSLVLVISNKPMFYWDDFTH